MSTLIVKLLGSPQILLNGKLCTFRTRKAIGLLAYLAVTQQMHLRESLTTLFWPDADAGRGKNSLRQTLVRLRKVLGDEWIDLQGQMVGINWQADITIDVLQFESLAATGEADEIHEAIQLYRDDFLAGLTLRNSPLFDEWSYFEQERLRRVLAAALEMGVGLCAKTADFEQAIHYAQRLVALDGLNEVAQRQLMQLYAQVGQRTAALQQYQTCKTLLANELGVEPEAATRTLHDAILQHRIAAVADEPAHAEKVANLPVAATSFVGREAEQAELVTLLQEPNCRLLTLLGLGGIGKTRLALEVAQKLQPQFAAGVCFVPLAAVQSPRFLVSAIAAALDFSFQGADEPETQLLAYLADRQLLLLLDNFEHLLAGSEFVGRLLRQTTAVKLLVTSREKLDLASEWLVELHGLPYPDVAWDMIGWSGVLPEKTAVSYSAVQLFLQRARQAKHSFTLTPNEPHIIRICQLVEGMPLAIELAAAWVRMLTCAEIVKEIGSSLDLLATTQRDSDARHRSMRAVFNYSWQMLSPVEQQVLAALSVFRNGFSQEAAETVADASLFVLYSLLNKSLLRRNATGRYEMHELLRQFAREKLADMEAVAERHSAYYATLLHDHESHLFGEQQAETLKLFGEDLENIYLGWLWAAEQGKVQRLGQSLHSLYNFHAMRSLYEPGQQIFGQAMTLIDGYADYSTRQDSVTVTQLMIRQAEFLRALGKMASAEAVLRDALSLSQQIGLAEEEALCYQTLGVMALLQGRYVQANEWLQQALAWVETQDLPHRAAYLQMAIGGVEQALGNYEAANDYHGQSLAAYEGLNYQWGVAHSLRFLGMTAERTGALETAVRYHQQSLEICQTINHEAGIAFALNNLGQIAEKLGQQAQAQRLYQQALLTSQESRTQTIEVTSLHNLGRMMLVQGEVEQANRYLNEALQTAVKAQVIPQALDILVDMAAQLASGQPESGQAQQIATLVQRHSASQWHTRQKAQTLSDSLPPPSTTHSLSAPYDFDEKGALQWMISHFTKLD